MSACRLSYIPTTSVYRPRVQNDGDNGDNGEFYWQHTSGSAENLMHGPSEQVVDELLDEQCFSLACFLDPAFPGRTYFFSHGQYVVVNVNSGTTNDTIAWGPKPIFGNWPTLVNAGYYYLDWVV
jgi:hypothetical protein